MTSQTPQKRVLIVDDEPSITFAMVEGLGKLGRGYIFETAVNGQEALNKVRENTYDLIITDYMMPGMSGITLVQNIRKVAPTAQIIMMTAYGSTGLQEVVGSLKLDGYIDKPVRIEKIREIVKAALGQTNQGEDPYRSGKRQLGEDIRLPIQNLQVNTNARCVLLLSAGGFTIDMAGQTNGLDIAGISALVAANFMAATELARMLGNNSVFKSSYHEGPDYNIYAYDINGDCLLAVIFGTESKTGMVRYYTNKVVEELTPFLQKENNHNHAIEGLSEAVGLELEQLLG